MQITKPTYYDAFSCLAGACPDTCCGTWRVVIDQETLAHYRSVEGALGEQLRAALTEVDGEPCFAMDRGRCKLLTQDGLCAIQKALGADALCKNCARYPRFVTEIGARRELGLSLSCPAAARLILVSEAPFSLCPEQTDEPITAIHELSPELILTLRALRAHALDLARDRSIPFGARCARLLALCAPVDRAKRDRDLPGALETGLAQAAAPLPTSGGEKLCGALQRIAGELEYLQADHKARLEAALAAPVPDGWTACCPELPMLWEQLLCYGICKYFPRAAFDRSIWPAAVFSTVLPLLLRQLLYAEKGHESDTALRLAWTLSRELEHSEGNMILLLRRFRGRAFRPDALIGVFAAIPD